MKRAFRFEHAGPDFLMDELTEALRSDEWFEFELLFSQVYNKLRERKGSRRGKEMLRLRTYEKLQDLVQKGAVEKIGKTYRGIASALAALAERAAAIHCQHLLNIVKQGNPNPGGAPI